HPDRAERACSSMRARCANMDPRRANRLRHPAARLYGEYVWAFVTAIRHAPLSPADRRECYRWLMQWLASRAVPGQHQLTEPPAAVVQPIIAVDAVVAGREKKPS